MASSYMLLFRGWCENQEPVFIGMASPKVITMKCIEMLHSSMWVKHLPHKIGPQFQGPAKINTSWPNLFSLSLLLAFSDGWLVGPNHLLWGPGSGFLLFVSRRMPILSCELGLLKDPRTPPSCARRFAWRPRLCTGPPAASSWTSKSP